VPPGCSRVLGVFSRFSQGFACRLHPGPRHFALRARGADLRFRCTNGVPVGGGVRVRPQCTRAPVHVQAVPPDATSADVRPASVGSHFIGSHLDVDSLDLWSVGYWPVGRFCVTRLKPGSESFSAIFPRIPPGGCILGYVIPPSGLGVAGFRFRLDLRGEWLPYYVRVPISGPVALATGLKAARVLMHCPPGSGCGSARQFRVEPERSSWLGSRVSEVGIRAPEVR
jgi:hypothetical protein